MITQQFLTYEVKNFVIKNIKYKNMIKDTKNKDIEPIS